MFSGGNKVTKVFRIIIDILNVVIGIAVVVMAVFAFMDTEGKAWLFPIIFLLGGSMNCFTGIKHIMCDKKVNGIILEVVAVILFGIAYATYVAVSGI